MISNKVTVGKANATACRRESLFAKARVPAGLATAFLLSSFLPKLFCGLPRRDLVATLLRTLFLVGHYFSLGWQKISFDLSKIVFTFLVPETFSFLYT